MRIGRHKLVLQTRLIKKTPTITTDNIKKNAITTVYTQNVVFPHNPL